MTINHREDWNVTNWSAEQKEEFGTLLNQLAEAYEENAKLLGKLVSIYEGMVNDDQTEDAAEQPEDDQTEDEEDEDVDMSIIAYNGSGKPLRLYDLYTDEETTEAAALYDGGWRKEDAEELAAEYEMDQDHAERLCEIMKYYEIWDKH